ncbi:MAG: hypothetical protein HXY34_13730 [Candidatus Thorarchaeota archaeon]|nr:hypothetical protein [Candidatus Thorarchaeota archaeon]
MLEVGIPDASLIDCSDLREKTIKAGVIGRALAIFRVERVFVYRTGLTDPSLERDRRLLLLLLRYLDTPQYLRRLAFRRTPSLQYAGLLPPLRTRSHPVESFRVHKGEVRWGIQVRPGKIDIGLKELVDHDARVSDSEPTLFRVTSEAPQIKLEPIQRCDVHHYFGYEVAAVDSLARYLDAQSGATRIALSRKAAPFHTQVDELVASATRSGSVVAVFGGPRHGIQELFHESGTEVMPTFDFWINTVRDQGTETVRLEEAVLVSLGLLNSVLEHPITRRGYYAA